MDNKTEVVIRLMRGGLGIRADVAFDWESVDWLQVIQLADFNHILPTVAAGLEEIVSTMPTLREVSTFANEIVRKQLERESRIIKELTLVTRLLNQKGIIPLALKGACFLVESNMQSRGWRFMSDIDILVPPEAAYSAVACLKDAGYSNDEKVYRSEEDNHLPSLTAPNRIAPVEIHTRVLARPSALPLDLPRLLQRATLIECSAGKILLPSIQDRLIHLIAHGAVESHQYRRRHIVLREALDFEYLTRHSELDLDQIHMVFVKAGHGPEFCAFIEMMGFLLGRRFSSSSWAGQHQRWVEETLRSLGSADRQLYWIGRDTVRLVVGLLSTQAGWRRLLGLVTNPARRRSIFRSRLGYYFDRYR